MHSRKIKQRIGPGLAVMLLPLGMAVSLLTTVWQAPSAAAATPTPPAGEATWFYKPQRCRGGGVGIAASLAYTDNSGKTVVFNCQVVNTSSGQDYIELDGNTNCTGHFDAIRVGRQIEQSGGTPVGTSYHTTTQGRLNSWIPNQAAGECIPQGDPAGWQTIQLTNAYDDGSKPAPGPIGTASWSKVDPLNPIGVLNLTLTSNLGPYASGTKEVFTQKPDGITGNIMTLTGTMYADKTNCPNYVDTLQVGAVNNYWSDTTAVLSIGNASEDLGGGVNCSAPISGIITLTGTYVAAGGTDPTLITTTEKPCIFDVSNLNPINWILCAVDSLAWTGATALNNSVQSTLYVDPSQLFDPQGSVLYTYDILRNIALTILLLAGLVMVASQAAGLEVFSAYTVRKALPRIVFAAVGLSLAWPILQFAVIFSNDLGTWVQTIILAAASPVQGTGTADFGGELITYVASGSVLVGLGTAGLVSLAITTLISLLVAFVTLVIRQIIIFICILIAPLAIALMVLPGTASLGKLWRTTLVGALAMFPIVMAFLASGDAVGRVAYFQARAAGDTSSIYYVIALVAKYIPYLFIGTALGLANKTIGGINQTLHGVAKPILDGETKRRQAIRAENSAKFWAGSRYNPNNPASTLLGGRAVNFLGRHLGAGVRGNFGFGAAGQIAMANSGMMSHDDAMKSVRGYAANSANQNFLAAVAAGGSRQTMRAIHMSERDINNGLAAARGVAITPQLQTAALEGLGKTGSQTVVRNLRDLDTLTEAASHGNATLRGNTRSVFQGAARASGRVDIGRDNTYRALTEMNLDKASEMRDVAAQNLFAPGNSPDGAHGTGVIQAMVQAEALHQDEAAQHIADIAYGMQFNTKLSPAVAEQVSLGLGEMLRLYPQRMADAQARWRDKQTGYVPDFHP